MLKTTIVSVTEEMPVTNEKFSRGFRWWGLGWMSVSLISLVLTDYNIFRARPQLLHDWHGIVIFFLSLTILAVFGLSAVTTRDNWPPSLLPSLAIVASLYCMVFVLIFIDVNFVWNLYIVFGVILSRFTGRRMLLLVTVLLLSFGIVVKAITWPLDLEQLNSLFGLSMGFYGTSALTLVMHRLVSERYKRNSLLEKLTAAHTELAEAHQKLAETAAQEQELAVLRERNRLAREMHDTLGHALVLVTVKLEVAQRLRERDPERSNRELRATQTLVRESMNELRASIANLRSPTLEREPVCRALSRNAREMAQRCGIHVTFDILMESEELPRQVEETLWKVGQEAIANIEKHAQASNVRIRVRRYDDEVLLRIEDDGVGLPLSFSRQKANGHVAYTSPEGHYGLSGMMERVERLGGVLEMKVGKERGTTVEVVLPLVETQVQRLGA